jgi:hypothetical protein
MFLDRLRYEARLPGRFALLVPCLIPLVGALFVVLLRLGQSKTANLFSACLEMFLPLAAGILVAAISGYDPALELQLSLPAFYRRTVVYRLGLIGVWTACVALLASICLQWTGFAKTLPLEPFWPQIVQFVVRQFLWFAPLLWFLAIGLFLALLLRSRSASIALLGGIWVAENIMYGLLIDTPWLHPVFLFAGTLTPISVLAAFWLTNRLELIATAGVFLLIGWLQLRQTEALLQKTQGGEE